jgi:hypothetical protein
MAAAGGTYVTLSDLKGRIDPTGQLDQLIEQANDTNQFIQDALMLEGNMTSGQMGTIRTGLPAGTWRKLYGGVPNEKSATKQITDTVGILESYSTVDQHLYEMAPDGAAFRAQEDASFMEGFTQTMEATFFYGDTDTDPEQYMGLAPRYVSATGSEETSENVIDNGGTIDANTSIWMVTWDPKTCFTFYGKGTSGGFQATNKGLQTQILSLPNSPSQYEAYVTHFKWQLGLHLADWRYVARLGGIDVATRDSTGLAAAFRDDVIQLVNKPPDSRGRQVLYMNKKTKVAIEILASDPTVPGMHITISDFFGEPIPHLWGIPIRVADQITDTEADVT